MQTRPRVVELPISPPPLMPNMRTIVYGVTAYAGLLFATVFIRSPETGPGFFQLQVIDPENGSNIWVHRRVGEVSSSVTPKPQTI